MLASRGPSCTSRRAESGTLPVVRLAPLLALCLVTCASRTITLVQQHHGREFHCDRRYVEVEHEEGERGISRGCGFEADWDCRDGACQLHDAHAHGMGAP